MANREEDLRNLTHKGDLELPQRVFYTLTDERKSAKAIALLVDHLHVKRLLSNDEIDDLLLDAAGAGMKTPK